MDTPRPRGMVCSVCHGQNKRKKSAQVRIDHVRVPYRARGVDGNFQMHAKKGGKTNGKNTLAAMTLLLQGLSEGEQVRAGRS